MAKEQKAIAKLLDKDGITVDFWRFPIKNVDKIIGQVLELVGKSRLGLSKDNLKNFDTFVIQTTEPNGTVIDTVFECSDVEFLDLVKEDYKDYFGYYPSEDKFDSEKWSYILSGHKGYKESKKSARKSLKEKLNDSGDVRFNDIYSCDLINVLTVTVYDKELYEKLREEDLILYQKGIYEQIDWKSFQDEIGYLRDDIYASDDFDVKFTLSNGVLIIDVLDNTDKDIIMEYKLEPKIVN